MKKCIVIATLLVSLLLVTLTIDAKKVKTTAPYNFCPFCGSEYGPDDLKLDTTATTLFRYEYTCSTCGANKSVIIEKSKDSDKESRTVSQQ